RPRQRLVDHRRELLSPRAERAHLGLFVVGRRREAVDHRVEELARSHHFIKDRPLQIAHGSVLPRSIAVFKVVACISTSAASPSTSFFASSSFILPLAASSIALFALSRSFSVAFHAAHAARTAASSASDRRAKLSSASTPAASGRIRRHTRCSPDGGLRV